MTGYFPQYANYTPAVQPTYQQTQPSGGINWVQGEAGAKSYLVAPGNSVLLMDSEGSRFYIKTADTAGMPSLRMFEYKECTVERAKTPVNATEGTTAEYVTRDEYDDLKGQIEALEKRLLDKSAKTRKAESDE